MSLAPLQPRELKIAKLAWDYDLESKAKLQVLSALFLYDVEVAFEFSDEAADSADFHCYFGVSIHLQMKPAQADTLPLRSLECYVQGLFSVPVVVEPKDFDERYIYSCEQLLYGFVRGVVFSSTSGMPGGPVLVPAADLDFEHSRGVVALVQKVRDTLTKLKQQMVIGSTGSKGAEIPKVKRKRAQLK